MAGGASTTSGGDLTETGSPTAAGLPTDGGAPTRGVARRVVLLSIGDELLAGDIVDTNAQWLATLCAERGHRVVAQATTGDRIDEIERALHRAQDDGDLLLITGGLGPTADDLTRDGVASAFGLALEERPVLIDEQLARLKGRALTPGARRQAEMPLGAHVLSNPRGTAPGFMVQVDQLTVAVMPGVPSEMKAMAPALFDDIIGQGDLQPPRRLQAAGLSESEAGHRLGDLMDPARAGCRVGITVSLGSMSITVRGEHAPAMDAAADEAARRLGDAVYSRGKETLAQRCVSLLTEQGRTVSCAESCTGGLLAGALTGVPGSSVVFRQGAVTYANEVKQVLLGVPPELLAKWGAVSEPVARAMAEGQLRTSGADVALAVTGIAGPGGGTAEKPVGMVHYALADSSGTVSHMVSWPGSRDDIRGRSVNMTLDLLRRRLTGLL